MKKVLIKIISLIACFIICLSLVACNNSAKDNGDGTYYGRVQIIKEGSKILVENGESDYKILIPQEPVSAEEYAASEFNQLLSQVSGVKLEIVTDADLSASTKYISIGDTVMAEEANAILGPNGINRNGFKIKSYKDGLLIVAGDRTGLIYGVYRFFEKQCNYMYYTPDEIRLDKSSTIKMHEYDFEDWPDFPNREVFTYANKFYPDQTMHYYMNGSMFSKWSDMYGEGTWWSSLSDQSLVLELLPYSEYRANYPDWYFGKAGGSNATNPQLCFSKALDDMNAYEKGEWFDEDGNWIEGYADGSHGLFWTLCYNLIKNYVSVQTDKTLFQLGMSDNNDFCNCARCKEGISAYTRTGLVIRFVNQVADVVKEWQEANCPERTIYLTVFAYLTVVQPPVKLVNGAYQPIDESVKVRDNIVVRYAPIEEGYLFPLLNKEKNANAYSQMNGWKALANHFAVWDYTVNFGELIQHFPSWMTMYDNLKSYYDYGYVDIYNQGNSYGLNLSFYWFDMWMRTRILWDIHADYDTLAKEFLTAYYGVGADCVQEYMDRLSLIYLDWAQDGYNGNFSATANLEKWPIATIQSVWKIFEKGFKTIENDSTLTPERKQVLMDRLDIETSYIRYLEIKLHSSYFSKDELIARIDSFEALCKMGEFGGLRSWTTIYEEIAKWRESL
ncbi:MAG: DUF4838 domain-containing protein [Clostridia bacterium]|nr:DUF4838 domain-containing protein [Clostridia bacterium]MBR2499116.1 DUF4838 domain-containing protein [Clostridia bacterium]